MFKIMVLFYNVVEKKNNNATKAQRHKDFTKKKNQTNTYFLLNCGRNFFYNFLKQN